MSMTLIQTVTVGAGGAANITFTGIPGTYTDLIAVCSIRSVFNDNVDGLRFRINSDSSALYSYRELVNSGTSVFSFTISGQNEFRTINIPAGLMTSNSFGNAAIHIPNYSGSTTKSLSADWVVENNSSSQFYSGLEAYAYNSTNAVTSLLFFTGSTSNFAQNSSISLYGITKGSGGATVS